MTGFIYKWTNRTNGNWYIGSHKGTTDDGYRHSSKILKFAEEKHGLENFTREILFEGDYEKDKIKSKEAKFLNQYDAANNRKSYNHTNITGTDCFSKEAKQKISDKKTGVPRPDLKDRPKSIETKQKMRIAKLGKPSLLRGRSQSREHIDKRIAAILGKRSSMKGKTYEEIYGPLRAEEQRKLRKQSHNTKSKTNE